MFAFNVSDEQIKDYSSDKKQDIKYIGDLGGYSFEEKNISSEQVKKDAAILSKVLKYAVSLPKEKKIWLNKLVTNIKKKKIVFKNGLNYEKAVNILNLSLDDIVDLVEVNKKNIIYKMFSFNHLDEIDEYKSKLDIAELCGINISDLEQWAREAMVDCFIRSGFVNKSQIDLLYDDYLNNRDMDNEKDIIHLAQKLKEVFNENQKEDIEKNQLSYEYMAKSLLYYGKYTNSRFSIIRRILTDEFFDDEDREPIKRIIKGIDRINLDLEESVEKDVNINPEAIEFQVSDKTNNNFKKITKNIQLINAFQDHNYMINLLETARSRYIKIPNILVNFDTHSDIYVNNKVKNSLADWVNIFSISNNITDVYWVCPSRWIDNLHCYHHFFGEANNNIKAFLGNYNKLKPYKSLKNPLSQSFLINIETGNLLSDSINYTKEELDEKLKTGEYRKITIHTCTKDNLPVINKDVILSIDGDYFNCSGFDTNPVLEQLPFNINKIYNDFLDIWCKKLKRATIVGLCVSPEYVGVDAIGITKGFYEYILNVVKKTSKKFYY